MLWPLYSLTKKKKLKPENFVSCIMGRDIKSLKRTTVRFITQNWGLIEKAFLGPLAQVS